jgi:hypothetical protein
MVIHCSRELWSWYSVAKVRTSLRAGLFSLGSWQAFQDGSRRRYNSGARYHEGSERALSSIGLSTLGGPSSSN